jgi:NodT family efflux transporter outer membrane factor (OMF) lipoprotein
VQQALTQLNATEARIPQLESDLQKTRNALSTLLGLPPARLAPLLDGELPIPTAPSQIAVGIPADLLRRRPDVRSAEYQAAAQCAQIGVAKADLYPAFSLTGNFGVLSTDVGSASIADVFSWKNRSAAFGPSVKWDLFNYGRLTNNVRLQDARFQELLVTYQNVVLRAQQEVEDGLVAFLKAQDRVAYLKQSVDAARRTVDLVKVQYREGATDYTTVLTAQQSLLDQADSLAGTQGDIPLGLIATYRALGGGWEIREENDIIPPETKKVMAERTNWGGLLEPNVIPPPPAERHDGSPPKPDW